MLVSARRSLDDLFKDKHTPKCQIIKIIYFLNAESA